MKKLKKQLEEFFELYDTVIIVNTKTDEALLCLKPEMDIYEDFVLLKFDSLNDRGGNSTQVKAIQGTEKDTLYIENEFENILMLQALTLKNYHYYIKNQYTNTKDFTSLDELKSFIKKQ
ncbi:MAG: hypothetical protein V1679_02795 [Candidatus Peregrinibacteria bacterium]